MAPHSECSQGFCGFLGLFILFLVEMKFEKILAMDGRSMGTYKGPKEGEPGTERSSGRLKLGRGRGQAGDTLGNRAKALFGKACLGDWQVLNITTAAQPPLHGVTEERYNQHGNQARFKVT